MLYFLLLYPPSLFGPRLLEITRLPKTHQLIITTSTLKISITISLTNHVASFGFLEDITNASLKQLLQYQSIMLRDLSRLPFVEDRPVFSCPILYLAQTRPLYSQTRWVHGDVGKNKIKVYFTTEEGKNTKAGLEDRTSCTIGHLLFYSRRVLV
jgi:hypothetical protein